MLLAGLWWPQKQVIPLSSPLFRAPRNTFWHGISAVSSSWRAVLMGSLLTGMLVAVPALGPSAGPAGASTSAPLHAHLAPGSIPKNGIPTRGPAPSGTHSLASPGGASGLGAVSTISTVAGGDMGPVSGTSTAQYPEAVATATVWGTSYAYVADPSNDVIRAINLTTGSEQVVAGDHSTGGFGTGYLATNAQLTNPRGVAGDSAGDLVISNTNQDVVDFVPGVSGSYFGQAMTAGYIYTIAGNGTQGSSGNGGPATSAELNGPQGVAIEPAGGGIAIADTGNNIIRFVPATSGTYFGQSMTADDIYTIAGNGTAGLSGNGGLGTSAELSSPVQVSLDSSGNLAFADQANNEIRYVANTGGTHFGQSMTAGYIYDLAGNGTSGYTNGVLATSAELSSPGSVAFDPSGDLVIGDSGNMYVRFVPASPGTYYAQSMTADYIYTIAGVSWCGDVGNGGPASSAWVCFPVVAVDSADDLVIADTWINDVRIVAAGSGNLAGQSVTAGDIYQIAGNGNATYSGNGGPAAQAELNDPDLVRVDSAGDVVITDFENHAIRFVPASSGTYYGQIMTAGDLYTIAGTGSAGFSGNGGLATSAQLNSPQGAVTGPTGNLAIADTNNDMIRFVPTTSGTYFGTPMTADDIYTVAGTGTAGFTGTGGPATSAELNSPTCVAVDSAGGILIVDSGNAVIRYIAPANGTYYGQQGMIAGDIYTIAGNGTTGYSGNGGPALSAEFNGLSTVFLDSAGDLVISDSMNNVVRFIPLSSGTYYGQSMTAEDIYTIAGNGTYGNSGLGGPATSAEFAVLNDVTVDPFGDLYITDSNNEYIRLRPSRFWHLLRTGDDRRRRLPHRRGGLVSGEHKR